ncbi:glycoside hydrolase family 2 protein [Parafilimonas sp.]|uniref:glycoside hydrolase family 2 protein n=1 Tax=Parafilimonas sp. TaxID=1969739 RepID=UPI0039E59EFE
MFKKPATILLFSLVLFFKLNAQPAYELNEGWKCMKASSVKEDGNTISSSNYNIGKWKPATVPGTVLTTMLNNKEVPDPFYGMNNEKIPDIYNVGAAYYTYWFVKDFTETASSTEQVYLKLRGINYSCNVFLNGRQLNKTLHKGMFLSQEYNITSYLNKNGKNRLAVIVYPPDAVGHANGGQGGDGTIARNISHQYVAGWDWIQPIRDRNTGIWDKVLIEKTQQVKIQNTHIVTDVPGIRKVEGAQQPAIIHVSTELYNPTEIAVSGIVSYELGGNTVSEPVTVPAQSTRAVQLKDLLLQNPKLWWPNTYGPQNVYPLNLKFTIGNVLSDVDSSTIGIREITTDWNNVTRSREVAVNGQKIFIKGGNWIISDAMLRFSKERYDAEVRFHHDMNLNLIRIWGGAITERPEFYAACDKYGMLVMQDFWGSGDCNGRWVDPMKKDDQWARRNYPDDHHLFIASAADQIKLIRNHPSLAIWCGGNEITLPQDIFHALKDSLMPLLDGTRWFIDYSNSDSMSYNFLGGNGDGPYGIQDIKTFWGERTFPFNSEVGSVGAGDYTSLKRFLPPENLIPPVYENGKYEVDSVWQYHKYIGYDKTPDAYGGAKDAEDFATKAQLINYDQYRGLIEGFSAHAWEWYTGVIIWKTQNPWTALRGQMYDYYLDPNACLYGLKTAGDPLHIMFNPVDSSVMAVNNTFETHRDMMLQVLLVDMNGKERMVTQAFSEIGPTVVKKYLSIGPALKEAAAKQGVFLVLRLLNLRQQPISDNLYWLPDSTGNYSGLQTLASTDLNVKAIKVNNNQIQLTLNNPADKPVAFFNRVSLINSKTKERILPTFYSDNYISVLPGASKTIMIDCSSMPADAAVEVEGWNTGKHAYKIN